MVTVWLSSITYNRTELTPAMVNHKGATLFPQAVDEYIETEQNHGAIMGPFLIPPFMKNIGISPISTRPKKNSLARRIILDLSFPLGGSVNDGIDKDTYCGVPVRLTYPTIDVFTKRIYELGTNCLLWKRDISRYFRLVPLCPGDYSLVGYWWRQEFWFDKFMPMGLRSACYVAQSISSAIAYIHRQAGFWCLNYVDDYGSAEPKQTAWDSFQNMGHLLRDLGATEAKDKAVLPCT